MFGVPCRAASLGGRHTESAQNRRSTIDFAHFQYVAVHASTAKPFLHNYYSLRLARLA